MPDKHGNKSASGNEEGKTFILGLGAAKSGTSWLYDFLSSHPNFRPGPAKEMHVLSNEQSASLVRNVIALPWHRYRGLSWLNYNLQKAYYRSDWVRYFGIYAKILSTPALATGDMSPSYIALRADIVSLVRAEFANRNIRVVGVLLLRDPVERLLSNFRYNKKLINTNPYRGSTTLTVEEMAMNFLEEQRDPTDLQYENGLSLITECFSEKSSFVSLYEDLFSQNSLDRLCDVSGLSRHEGNYSRKINSTETCALEDESITNSLREKLSPAYDAAVKYFGREHLRGRWKYL